MIDFAPGSTYPVKQNGMSNGMPNGTTQRTQRVEMYIKNFLILNPIE
jgi:hypothetical protein